MKEQVGWCPIDAASLSVVHYSVIVTLVNRSGMVRKGILMSTGLFDCRRINSFFISCTESFSTARLSVAHTSCNVSVAHIQTIDHLNPTVVLNLNFPLLSETVISSTHDQHTE